MYPWPDDQTQNHNAGPQAAGNASYLCPKLVEERWHKNRAAQAGHVCYHEEVAHLVLAEAEVLLEEHDLRAIAKIAASRVNEGRHQQEAGLRLSQHGPEWPEHAGRHPSRRDGLAGVAGPGDLVGGLLVGSVPPEQHPDDQLQQVQAHQAPAEGGELDVVEETREHRASEGPGARHDPLQGQDPAQVLLVADKVHDVRHLHGAGAECNANGHAGQDERWHRESTGQQAVAHGLAREPHQHDLLAAHPVGEAAQRRGAEDLR
mmetsp:Transcript_60664/g.146632  ORF Transcript_60664/g.146632 Transcript_60664/m.146632 type:complete len:261 (+) Transcript_60664:692-1474(+)